MRGETTGKPLKYAGNGDFQRGTEARIINNLEIRMRRRFFHAHEAAQRRRRGETHTYAEYKEAPETPI